MRLEFIAQSATSRSVNVSNLRAMNCYPEVVEARQGKCATALYGTPGLQRFATVPGSGGMRALATSSTGRVFAVRGPGIYELYADGRSTLLPVVVHGMLRDSGPVSWADTGRWIVLVEGPVGGCVIDLQSSTVLAFTDPAWQGADRVAFLDNWLVFNRPDSQQFYLFGRDATAFDALDFASAEGAPDRLVSLIVNHRELVLLGATTTETWYNAGGAPFPFARNPSGFVETGCAAAHSVAKMGEQVYWLGQDERGAGLVWRTQGYLPQRISTHPLEQTLASYARVDDALGWCQQQEGHHFYWLTFPTANATWVYDAVTGVWHERGWLNPATGQFERHRANCATFGFGQHLVGDFANGNVYALSPTTYDDDGAPLTAEFTLPPIYDAQSLHRVAHAQLQLDLEAGVGLGSGSPAGDNPQVMLQWSNDAGHTWSNEHMRSAGAVGEYRRRVVWRQLGQARDRRYRVRFAAPCKRVFLNCYAEVEVLGA